MSPEQQIIVDKYLELNDPDRVAIALNTPKDKVLKILKNPSVRRYIDELYLQKGFANKHKIQRTLDKMIEQKVEEAEEAGVYTKKDLADLLELSHKFRIAEEKLMIERLRLEQALSVAQAKIDQTESLTGRKLAAADDRFHLKLEHDKKLREKEVNAYSDLLKRLLQPKEVFASMDLIEYSEISKNVS